MPPTVAELIAALPDIDQHDEDGVEPDHFQGLFDRLAQRPVPVGSLRRLWSLGGLQAKIAVAYLLYWIRGPFQNSDSRQQALAETHLKTAVRMLATMGYMRGAVMKIGQLIADFPDVVPDQLVETLSRLHFQAPPMHYSLLREHLRNELGGDPDDIFASFEKQAFAAASLGQVHRAELATGEQVAVKIQYPGIARTIRSDFRNLHAALTPLRLSKDWNNLTEQLDDIRKSLELETDYETEAESLRIGRTLFHEDDGIVVPKVYDQFSTRRVLTMEYLDARTTDQFLATNPSPELRNEFGRKVFRATLRLFVRRRMIYSDPHPGNFLYFDDGRLGFIDFGAIRTLSDEELRFCRQATMATSIGTLQDRLETVQQGCLFTDDEMQTKAEYVKLIVYGCDYMTRPHIHDGPFDFGDEKYLREGFEFLARAARYRELRQQPVNLFLQRRTWELNGLLYRLRARFDAGKIAHEESHAADEWEDLARAVDDSQ
jgi:predicted unusual protein kinase regulating ubiquinone biosynthesis (AarF/ABC1/UbiB family)